MKKISIKGATWDSAFLAFSKGLTIICNILLAKILSTGLTLEGYGTYAQATLIISTGSSIIILGMGDALAYYFNYKGKEIDERLRARIVNTVFFIEILLGLVLFGAILIGQNAIVAYFSNNALFQVFLVIAILPVFANVISLMQILCVSSGRAKWMSIYSLILTIIRIGVVYLSVYILKNIVWIFIATLIMDICHVFVYNVDLRKKGIYLNPVKISPKHIKSVIAYGLPMGIYSVTSSLTRDIAKFIIGRMGGTEELAIYSNCSKILPLDFFVTSFALVLIPYIYRRVSEGRREESAELFSSYLKVGYYTVWTLGAAVLVAPVTMISFLYADVYIAGKWVFILYIFDSMLRFASVHLILTAAGKAKRVMAYSIISLVLNVVLSIAFYHWWGLIGPAIAAVIVAFVYMMMILSDTVKTIEVKWTDVFDFKEMLWFVVTLVVAWAVTFTLNGWLCTLGLHRYLAMIISMAVFGISILVIHFKKIFAVLKKINSFKL